MKYNKYIISFAPGSSGRIIRKILDRLILNSENHIDIYPNNCAHDVHNKHVPEYTGISVPNPNIFNIYDIVYFDPMGKTYSSILPTHVYPNFNKINDRYDDIGIIVINFNTDDVKEIQFNSFYKNKNIQLTNSELDKSANLFSKKYANFMKILDYPENCLVLQYTDLFRDLTDNFNAINQLKEFTGISNNPASVVSAYEKYREGRAVIVNQFGLR
jgi:hypothetical protein